MKLNKKQTLLLINTAVVFVLLIGAGVFFIFCNDGSKNNLPTTSDEINVVAEGADNTGKTDNTEILSELHKSGKKIYYPNGTYLFNGLTLELSGGVRFESTDGVTVRNSISDLNILRFDDFGNLIGLMQNHLEKNEYDFAAFKSGSLVSPPLSKKKNNKKADLMVYWYNDFGLQAQTGWVGWKYWTWNQHGVENNEKMKDLFNSRLDPYDPALHPLLGFYYGDDPTVLDWQCYWLNEYGADVVAVQSTTLENWENPEARDHWVYQLFNHTPNFKSIRYTAFVETPWAEATAPEIMQDTVRKAWINTLEKLYAAHDNYYTIEKNGKKYPVIHLWQESALRTVFDPSGGFTNTEAFFLEMTENFKKKGFDGLAMFSRDAMGEMNTPSKLVEYEKKGLLRYASDYVASDIPRDFATGKYTYPQIVDTFNPQPSENRIIGLATSMNTHTPHPSKWKCPGNSPREFERWLNKAITFLEHNPSQPKIITCYNLSEWGEGGSGLQPNIKDGFGYLTAVKNAILK